MRKVPVGVEGGLQERDTRSKLEIKVTWIRVVRRFNKTWASFFLLFFCHTRLKSSWKPGIKVVHVLLYFPRIVVT